MLRIVEETARAVTPHILGVEGVEGMPAPDPEATVAFLDEWLQKSIPEYGLLNNAVFLVFNLYSLVRKGHTFPRLKQGAQADLMEGLYKMKGLIPYEFLLLLSTPAVTSYYTRIDVQELLGFDIIALREEAKNREVTRDGGPLPPKGADTGSENAPGEDGE
jgi:hypothetical protein